MRAGQRIVYLINSHVGHLGIFVSARVARHEHRAILGSLAEIEALPPGLYEMKIDGPADGAGGDVPPQAVRFEERRVEDLAVDYPRAAFERARRLSERNERLYADHAGPLVRAGSSLWSAMLLRWLHPMRTSRYVFAEALNPSAFFVAPLAAAVSADRHPARRDNPFAVGEKAFLNGISNGIRSARRARDAAAEQAFATIFGGPSTPDGAGTMAPGKVRGKRRKGGRESVK